MSDVIRKCDRLARKHWFSAVPDWDSDSHDRDVLCDCRAVTLEDVGGEDSLLSEEEFDRG